MHKETHTYTCKKRPVQPDPSNDPKRAPSGILPQTSSQSPKKTIKQQPDPSNDHQTTTVHDHGTLFKYNRTHMQDLRDSIFGLSRHMTRNQKNAHGKQKKRMENMEFSTRFFLSKSVLKVPRVQNRKNAHGAAGAKRKKKNCFLILPFCVAQSTQAFACLLIAGSLISYTITSVSTFPACAVVDVETRFRPADSFGSITSATETTVRRERTSS